MLEEGETIIYPGKEDDNHREDILMYKFAAIALIEWTPVSERIIMARFYFTQVKLTIMHVYVPT